MAWLRHDSGGAATLKNQQVLGPDSPLKFDADGYAEVADDVVDQLLAMHAHVEQVSAPADNDTDGADDGFDAAAFVDRTPMDPVVADIESGDYDAHLDAIEAAASRQGVLDAVAARQG
jgi:hypothetical protein